MGKETLLAQAIGITSPQPNWGVQVVGKTSGQLVEGIIGNTITLIISIGTVAFVMMILWGAVEWIFSGGDKEKLAAARKRIVTAIIGVAILALAFVIINIVGQITGINFRGPIQIPQFGGSGTQGGGAAAACSAQVGGLWDDKTNTCKFPFGN